MRSVLTVTRLQIASTFACGLGAGALCIFFAWGIVTEKAKAAPPPASRPAVFGFEDCKYKLCNCEAEARGLDEQAHNLADLAATFIDRRVAENKPLDSSEIKLITESYKQIAANSKQSRDLAQKVADTLAAPFLP